MNAFIASDEAKAERAKVTAEFRQIGRGIREQLRAVGPSGETSGKFILEWLTKTNQPLSAIVRIITSLEIAGYVRVEGSGTLVSEELDPPDTVDQALYHATTERPPIGNPDLGYAPPIAASAAPVTIDQT